MSFDEFCKTQDDFADLPQPTINHGITESEINVMLNNPEKYALFALYLLTLSAYDLNASHNFLNSDALPKKEAIKQFNEVIKAGIYIKD